MGKARLIGWGVPFWIAKGVFDWYCSVRLHSGPVSLLNFRLVNVFEDLGLGKSWDAFFWVGNQAPVVSFREY